MPFFPWLTEEELQSAIAEKLARSKPISKPETHETDYSNAKPYNPDKLTTLRERLIAEQTRRARQLYDDLSFQASRRDLSPSETDKLEELGNFVQNSSNVIKDIRRQNAIRSEAQRLARLRPARERFAALHRSGKDRTAAIAGALEREQKQRLRLSRAAFERAKAKAAASRTQSHFLSRTYANRRHRLQEAERKGLLGERCVEYGKKGLIRVQVLFAKKHAKGHHSAKRFNALGCGDVL